MNILLMNNITFYAAIAHNVSVKKKFEIIKRGQQMKGRVINASVKIRTQEKRSEAASLN